MSNLSYLCICRRSLLDDTDPVDRLVGVISAAFFTRSKCVIDDDDDDDEDIGNAYVDNNSISGSVKE